VWNESIVLKFQGLAIPAFSFGPANRLLIGLAFVAHFRRSAVTILSRPPSAFRTVGDFRFNHWIACEGGPTEFGQERILRSSV
jgi:hypothetical protein